AVGADAVLLGGADRDAAVARAKVVKHVALVHSCELQHRIDHVLGRRHEDHIGLLGERLRLGSGSGGGKQQGKNETHGYSPAMVMWSMRMEPLARPERRRTSLPTATMPLNMSRKLPAMVISSTANWTSPPSTQ